MASEGESGHTVRVSGTITVVASRVTEPARHVRFDGQPARVAGSVPVPPRTAGTGTIEGRVTFEDPFTGTVTCSSAIWTIDVL
jgi:hypothetical protein